jgi:Tol biopolymer transport system component
LNIKRASAVVYLSWIAVLLINCTNSSNPQAAHPTSHIGINTETGWSDSPFISRDGKRLYFMYSRYDFAPWIKSGGSVMPQPTGPSRPGLHQSSTNPFDESDIYMSIKQSDGSWSEPVNLGFNGDFGDSSGMEINSGNTFVWLRGNGVTNDIVYANKNTDGSWSSPVSLGAGINNHSAGVLQDNPHISPDGTALWFVSNRPGGSGGKDIWFSYNASGLGSGSWSAPVNMGSPVNTNGDEDQPWISPVSSDVYWNGSQGLMHCLSNGSNCSNTPAPVVISGCSYVAEASMPDDGNSMYFACGDTTTFRVKIMFSLKQPNGSWGPAIPVD